MTLDDSALPNSSPPARLIVNADDFGLTEGINRAIVELYQAGALSSATLMANGAAFDHAVRVAKANPRLGVGCHVVLVDGEPVAPPHLVTSLLGKDGRLRSSLASFISDLHLGRISEQHIEAEALAQMRRIQAAGLRVTHLDTHKHTHMFPKVARPLMRAAQLCGIHAVRNPIEASWSARLAPGPLLRRAQLGLMRSFHRSFAELVREFGMSTTNGSMGIAATGDLTVPMLGKLLHGTPPGTWELVCHPGYNDAELNQVRTRLRRTRDTERLALAQEVPAARKDGTIELISFAAL